MAIKMSDIDRFEKYIFYSPDGCWYWIGGCATKGTRGVFQYQHKLQMAYRVSYILFVGTIPDGLLVCHTCDNPLCVNPYHLFIGTHKDNAEDMQLKGRAPCGERSGHNKVSTEVVIKIRNGEMSYLEFCETYGMTNGSYYHIKNKRNWKHI